MELLFITIGATIIFFAVSLRHIPADPPHIAVVTLLGQRLRQIKREGYRLFPFYPIIYNAVLINMTKKNQDLPPQIVRTRDLAELEISVSFTWTPNEDHAIEYLNHGGESGVKNVLSDMVRERLREWAIVTDWEKTLRAKDEVTAMLISAIAGFPTSLSKEEQTEIIKKVGQGNGVQPIPQLGITLNRLNIGEIKPKGKLVQAAELCVIEQSQRKGEKIEISHVMDLINKLKDELNISTEQALEIVQTERGKVSKKIQEIKGSVSGETIETVERIIGLFRQRRGT